MPLYKNVTKEVKNIQYRLNGTLFNKTLQQGQTINLPFFISKDNLSHGIELIEDYPMEKFVLFSENINSPDSFVIRELDMNQKVEMYHQVLRVYSKEDVKMYINYNKNHDNKDENPYIFIPQKQIYEKKFLINYLKYIQFENPSNNLRKQGIDVEVSLIKEFQFTY